MNITNRVTSLLGVKHPIIQAGMVWVSGWKLASAVSNRGGLGIIGSGSMKPELLKEHIQKCRSATNNPFGVNIPLLRGDAHELVKTVVDENVQIVFSSAGHPGKFIKVLKDNNIKVVHVVPTLKHGLKAQEVGCDAVVGEGVEAGGHNGADEITTFCLIPRLADTLDIPVIAAGGIADGRGIYAAMALGAEGVQIGSRFAATIESSAHENYKRKLIEAKENDTTLILKKIGMARLLKNDFSQEAILKETSGSDVNELKALLGQKRERLGIFEGDENQGMMEAGQGVGLINELISVESLFQKLVGEYDETTEKMRNINLH